VLCRRYRLLEIELDAVYRSMLLLKKKKYAAVKVGAPAVQQNDMGGLLCWPHLSPANHRLGQCMACARWQSHTYFLPSSNSTIGTRSMPANFDLYFLE
jgi:hypothetical protein